MTTAQRAIRLRERHATWPMIRGSGSLRHTIMTSAPFTTVARLKLLALAAGVQSCYGLVEQLASDVEPDARDP